MRPQDVNPGAHLVLAIALAGCYDVPAPACGFRCGPATACPADYTCGNDGRCHAAGSSPSLVCATPDAGVDAFAAPPVVLSVLPENGAMGVSVSRLYRAIYAVFDVEVTGVSASTVEVLDVDGVPIAGTVHYQADMNRAIFHPELQLQPGASYIATLSSGITSLSGAPLPNFRWTFSTGADIGPLLVLAMPKPGVIDVEVDANISITFDEPVQNIDTTSFAVTSGGPIAGTITASNGDRTFTYDPTTDLPAGSIITVTLSTAITDVVDNPLLAADFYSFTTAP